MCIYVYSLYIQTYLYTYKNKNVLNLYEKLKRVDKNELLH